MKPTNVRFAQYFNHPGYASALKDFNDAHIDALRCRHTYNELPHQNQDFYHDYLIDIKEPGIQLVGLAFGDWTTYREDPGIYSYAAFWSAEKQFMAIAFSSHFVTPPCDPSVANRWVRGSAMYVGYRQSIQELVLELFRFYTDLKHKLQPMPPIVWSTREFVRTFTAERMLVELNKDG